MTYNDAYTRGFMDKLAEYEKSAKSLNEMTPEERAEAQKARARLKAEHEAKIPKRKRKGGFWATRNDEAASAGLGLASTLGVTGVRALENGTQMLLWAPLLTDEYINGKLLGLDHGRGLFGRYTNKGKRKADELVHKARSLSQDFDYAHNLDNSRLGSVNRFMSGAAADFTGNFIGWGGLNVRKKVADRLLRRTIENRAVEAGMKGALKRYGGRALSLAMPAVTLIPSSSEGQLREMENLLRHLPPEYWSYYDPTSTVENQMRAPTLREYRKYNLPGSGVPTSVNGYIKVPTNWGHTEDGSPTVFQSYGT